MASIDMLSIRGIRAFGPDEPQVIKFSEWRRARGSARACCVAPFADGWASTATIAQRLRPPLVR